MKKQNIIYIYLPQIKTNAKINTCIRYFCLDYITYLVHKRIIKIRLTKSLLSYILGLFYVYWSSEKSILNLWRLFDTSSTPKFSSDLTVYKPCPLLRPIGFSCFQNKRCLLWGSWGTHKHIICKFPHRLTLQQVVHTVTTGLYRGQNTSALRLDWICGRTGFLHYSAFSAGVYKSREPGRPDG